jgi:hypothetical protein
MDLDVPAPTAVLPQTTVLLGESLYRLEYVDGVLLRAQRLDVNRIVSLDEFWSLAVRLGRQAEIERMLK